ncbi:uncharacterized protein LOC107045544 [Diachasma alloeum]|uniref:uncharacterized protein LOC107045544 n=1 Tax=Diachasma alloeum TaxID=454923 RepID=UPI0007383705|nr:uncharacterized protein LOC107045544 [Diachasma alloeum]
MCSQRIEKLEKDFQRMYREMESLKAEKSSTRTEDRSKDVVIITIGNGDKKRSFNLDPKYFERACEAAMLPAMVKNLALALMQVHERSTAKFRNIDTKDKNAMTSLLKDVRKISRLVLKKVDAGCSRKPVTYIVQHGENIAVKNRNVQQDKLTSSAEETPNERRKNFTERLNEPGVLKSWVSDGLKNDRKRH